ncbi:hypothetical protein CK203_050128 [Vitis vinifera]|uniref:Uncharacterized protein n=1 Tax=Vitis vinifera TaxID=29760 RepID=A0A438GYH8_VITVI|nr:hypothetical protein CK203_050128 [Vitis vinifera]
MEELYKSNLKGKKLAADEATSPHQVHDPNIVKTKGNLGKVASNFQNGRWCSCCKRVGHTIRKCLEATIPHTGNQRDMVSNLSSQCEIEMEMMPSTNSSVDMFATLHHGMRAEHLWNDPSNMYIDFSALVNVPGFQQYEETITTPCEGGDPNNTPNENDMQPFCCSLME